ncbi:MAG: hypothetical protein QM783_15715 [Phycisphaerales bacterium]
MRLMSSIKPLALALCAGLMLSAFAAPAMAQGGGGGGGGRGPGGGGGGGGMFGGGGGMFGNAMGAPVSKNDIEKMAKTLKLSADQQTAAQALLDGYLVGYQKKSDDMAPRCARWVRTRISPRCGPRCRSSASIAPRARSSSSPTSRAC